MGTSSESRTLTDLNIATADFMEAVVSQINYDNVISSRLLKKSEGVKGGERIKVPLEYGEEEVYTMGKYDQYNLQPKELLDAAFYEWIHIHGDMIIPEDELDVKNVGKEQQIGLAKTKSKNISRTMKKKFSQLLFTSVAGLGSNDPDSMVKIVATQDNTVGALDASAITAFSWNPVQMDLTAQSLTRENLLDISHTYCIDKILRKIVGQCTYDGNDGPTAILFTQGMFDIYEEFLIAQKRYDGKAMTADGGFNYLEFRGIPIFVDNNVPGGKLNDVTAGTAMAFVLNENYLGYRHSSHINFKLVPWKHKEDQPIYFSMLDWYGSFVCSRRDRQGAVLGLPTDATLNA